MPPYFDYPTYYTLKDYLVALSSLSYQCGAWINGSDYLGIVDALNNPDFPTALDYSGGVYSALTDKEISDTHLKFVFIYAPAHVALALPSSPTPSKSPWKSP